MHLLQHRGGDWVGIAGVALRRFVVEPRAPMTAQHSRDETLADACAGSGSLPVLVRTHLVRNLPPREPTFGKPGIGARRGALDELACVRKIVW